MQREGGRVGRGVHGVLGDRGRRVGCSVRGGAGWGRCAGGGVGWGGRGQERSGGAGGTGRAHGGAGRGRQGCVCLGGMGGGHAPAEHQSSHVRGAGTGCGRGRNLHAATSPRVGNPLSPSLHLHNHRPAPPAFPSVLSFRRRPDRRPLAARPTQQPTARRAVATTTAQRGARTHLAPDAVVEAPGGRCVHKAVAHPGARHDALRDLGLRRATGGRAVRQ